MVYKVLKTKIKILSNVEYSFKKSLKYMLTPCDLLLKIKVLQAYFTRF